MHYRESGYDDVINVRYNNNRIGAYEQMHQQYNMLPAKHNSDIFAHALVSIIIIAEWNFHGKCNVVVGDSSYVVHFCLLLLFVYFQFFVVGG